MTFTSDIIQAIKSVLPQNNTITLHEPYFKHNECAYVKECIDTGWVSSVGKYVDKFEKDLAEFTGAKRAIATVNGTAALHISYLLSGVQPGDEVLVPTLTFIGTINPILYCNARPHFIDADEKTLGIDANVLDSYLNEISIQTNGRCINKFTHRTIRALCVMHTLGHPVDLDPIIELCSKYNLTLIEDAAEALGSYYKGKHIGHHGLVGALSFNGNKIITTGGGGAILTDNIEIANKAKHLTTTAKLMHPWEFQHDQIGYNYRLPNINAALGCAQLEQLPYFLKTKRILAETYKHALGHIKTIQFIEEPSYAKSNYWLNAFLLDSTFANERDAILNAFCEQNLMVRPFWNLQHSLPMYKDFFHMPLPVAENLYKRLIKIPSSVYLGIRA